jgi:hypothetical protein
MYVNASFHVGSNTLVAYIHTCVHTCIQQHLEVTHTWPYLGFLIRVLCWNIWNIYSHMHASSRAHFWIIFSWCIQQNLLGSRIHDPTWGFLSASCATAALERPLFSGAADATVLNRDLRPAYTYVYMYVCMHVCKYVSMHVWGLLQLYLRIPYFQVSRMLLCWIEICALHTCMYVCHTYVCMYACMYVSIYACRYVWGVLQLHIAHPLFSDVANATE